MNDPTEPSNPLQGMLGDLLKMLGSTPAGGPDSWFEAARALAHSVATDGQSESNADPLDRIALEPLARVAELHVASATGLQIGTGGQTVGIEALGPGAWAMRALDAWRPLLQVIVASQPPPDLFGTHGSGPQGPGGQPESPAPTWAETGGGDPFGGMGELIGRFAATMGPVLVGMQFGSAAGHLSQRALGQYALPLPWPPGDLVVVPANIARFADDWSLPEDEARLWVCVHELTSHAVLSLPHVAGALRRQLEEAARRAAAPGGGTGVGLALSGDEGPEDLQRLLTDPEALLADLLGSGGSPPPPSLTALVTAVGGYVDHMTATVAATTIGSAPALREAWYRYRVTESAGEQAAGRLFGLDLSRQQVDRGAAFVAGVIARAGSEGLSRLWESERTLPTPAEVDAPGLWLERIGLPDDTGDGPADDTGDGPGGPGGRGGGGTEPDLHPGEPTPPG